MVPTRLTVLIAMLLLLGLGLPAGVATATENKPDTTSESSAKTDSDANGSSKSDVKTSKDRKNARKGAGAAKTADEDGQAQTLMVIVAIVLGLVLLSYRREVKSMVFQQLTSVRQREDSLFEATSAFAEEIQLQPLLRKVMTIVTDILDADRSTLFLYDRNTKELWSQIAQGIEEREIRFPCNTGIAGLVFESGESINIPDPYNDPRFNTAVDKKTGYRTENLLCMRVEGKSGEPLGVIQVLNKKGGPFDDADMKRLRAFSAQAGIAVQNAQLFEEVSVMKNYNETILQSMRAGIFTFDNQGLLAKMNRSAMRILAFDEEPVGDHANALFQNENEWLAESVQQVISDGAEYNKVSSDVPFVLPSGDTIAINAEIRHLQDGGEGSGGAIVVLEDISVEKRLRSTMARYLTQELAEQLLESGAESLGGQVCHATVLFADIRKFTAFTESVGAQETVSMLNAYFGIMVDRVLQNEGVLDKYMGDALMAVFGAPIQSDRHSDNAMTTAIEMAHALDAFNETRKNEGKKPIEIGIGLNADNVVSGNIGSPKRMDYTVIGPGVNLAARLESATKTYGSRILVSASTVAHLKDDYQLREVDLIRVRGQSEPVSVYDVLDAYPEGTYTDPEGLLDAHAKALALYRSGQWQEAKAAFQAISDTHGQDRLSIIYVDRCQRFQDTPPAADWDGVYAV